MAFRGHGFGPVSPSFLSEVVSYSRTTGVIIQADNCSVTMLDAEIRCVIPSGVGSQFSWYVSVGGQLSNAADVQTSYAAPIVSYVSVGDTNARSTLISTAGTAIVYIVGDMFGEDEDAVSLFINGVLQVSSVAIVVPHTLISFPAPVAEGYSLSLTLIVGGQAAVFPAGNDSLIIGGPTVATISIAEVAGSPPMLCAASVNPGTTRLIVLGINFGSGRNTTLRLDDVPCPLVEASHTRLVCITSTCAGECCVCSEFDFLCVFGCHLCAL